MSPEREVRSLDWSVREKELARHVKMPIPTAHSSPPCRPDAPVRYLRELLPDAGVYSISSCPDAPWATTTRAAMASPVLATAVMTRGVVDAAGLQMPGSGSRTPTWPSRQCRSKRA